MRGYFILPRGRRAGAYFWYFLQCTFLKIWIYGSESGLVPFTPPPPPWSAHDHLFLCKQIFWFLMKYFKQLTFIDFCNLQMYATFLLFSCILELDACNRCLRGVLNHTCNTHPLQIWRRGNFKFHGKHFNICCKNGMFETLHLLSQHR